MHETNRRGGRVNVSFLFDNMFSVRIDVFILFSRNTNGQCCISKCCFNAT